MYEHQKTITEGRFVRVVHVHNHGRPDEIHEFESEAEANMRAAIVRESLSWIGTPFVDCADIKGQSGGVDCAMKLVRCYVDTGRVKPFDPRPYNPRALLHSHSSDFIDWMENKLGAHEIAEPRLGCVVIFHWARFFAHGAILINNSEICHAHGFAGFTLVSRREEVLLNFISLGNGRGTVARPVRYYDVGGE